MTRKITFPIRTASENTLTTFVPSEALTNANGNWTTMLRFENDARIIYMPVACWRN
jgi:hypothetical protein